MRNVIKAIVCVAAAHLTTLMLASFIVKHTVTDTYAASFTGELVGTIVAIVALIILHRLRVLKFTFKGFKEGLLTGGV